MNYFSKKNKKIKKNKIKKTIDVDSMGFVV